MGKTHYVATINGKQQSDEVSVTICQLQKTVEELKAECDALRARIEEDAQSWYKLLHLMKKHGWHPGRTDDDLLDALETKLDALAADAARLDWLDNNIFNRENLDWITGKVSQTHNMWVMFSPVGVQGSARRILDAAMKGQS